MKKTTPVPAQLDQVDAPDTIETPLAAEPMPSRGGSWFRMPDGSLKQEGQE